MARSDSTVILSRAFALWCGVVAVATLYFARDDFAPAGAGDSVQLFARPVGQATGEMGARRIPAVLVVVAIAFFAIGTLSYVLAMQMYDLACRLPEYKGNIIAKVESVQGAGEGLFHQRQRDARRRAPENRAQTG